MSFPIDAVITWVDGADPAHARKLREYGGPVALQEEDVAGTTRFASVGEIYWCVESLRRFAPFIRTIYIVTDGQDPHIPDGGVPVKVVDHREIFRGFGECLPVFNSIAIESMTWRIPGLAEHYVELNDDFMLCAPLSPEDFFTPDGRPVCHASWLSLPFTWFTRAIKRREHGHRKVTFKGMMLNGARMAGARWRFLKIDHTPRPLLRSFFEEWYGRHPEQLAKNISFRFRNAAQFSSEELQYMNLHFEGRLLLRPVKGNLFYLEPKDRKDYISRKLLKLRAGNYRFCCFNSLDKAAPDDRAAVEAWINETFAK